MSSPTGSATDEVERRQHDSKSDEEHGHYITDINKNDVLLGRGSHLVKYQGNIDFRKLIHEQKDAYLAAVRHRHKDQIARDVVNAILSKNGRFLRKVETPEEAKKLMIPDDVPTAWVHVDEGIILEKVKQAFRDSCKEGGSNTQSQDQRQGFAHPNEESILHDSRSIELSTGANALDRFIQSDRITSGPLFPGTQESVDVSFPTNNQLGSILQQQRDLQLQQYLTQQRRQQYQLLLLQQMVASAGQPSDRGNELCISHELQRYLDMSRVGGISDFNQSRFRRDLLYNDAQDVLNLTRLIEQTGSSPLLDSLTNMSTNGAYLDHIRRQNRMFPISLEHLPSAGTEQRNLDHVDESGVQLQPSNTNQNDSNRSAALDSSQRETKRKMNDTVHTKTSSVKKKKLINKPKTEL